MSAANVLLLIKSLGRGGAEQLLVNAAPYLDRNRYRYQVAYMLRDQDALVPELREASLDVHCLEAGQGPGWVWRLRELVRSRRTELVHVHSPLAAIGARLGLRGVRGLRLVYTEHNVWERYHRVTYWGNLLTFSRNDHVFAVSDHVRTSIRYPRLLRYRRLPPVETLYHGIDPAAEREGAAGADVRRELGIAPDAPVVGTVANFKEHKGHRFLLEAADRVRREIPGARFVLVGSGPLETEIRRQVAKLSLQDAVVFAGFREDAWRAASAFDVFALASVHEGLSLAVVEALALGKPAVVTRAGGLPEVVEHGRQGLVVPARDPRALADAIIRLLEDAELRRSMGTAARRRADDFDIRPAVRRIETVYAGLLGGGAGKRAA